MSDNTKLYNTVQVQKLEAELQLISETVTHISPPPLTSDLSGETATCIHDWMKSQFCALESSR